jgi:hypothetical protein
MVWAFGLEFWALNTHSHKGLRVNCPTSGNARGDATDAMQRALHLVSDFRTF